jgi:NAD(P)-dependent dehydrogenase (short-subunit alcohol dehydrogenase family)
MADRIALVSGADPALRRALADRLTADGFALADDAGERLDALVHVVSSPASAPFAGGDAGRWFGSVMAELTPAFRAARAAAPALRRSPSGRLVFVGAGWLPADRPDATAAAAVHGGLVALTKTLARDLGPDGVTVNEVVVDPARPADPGTVAAAVSYLCGPAAGATVGQLVAVGRGGPLRP